MADDLMPDLSHLTEEERKIIEEVMQRQKKEENKEQKLQQQYEKELDEIERQINERKESANKLIGTQDDAICQICQKTKFADGIGHKCYYCQLRSCARCSMRTPIKVKDGKQTSQQQSQANQNAQQKVVWVCALCQKRQNIIGKTGKWFNKDVTRPTTPTPTGPSPNTTPTQSSAQPFSIISSFFGSSEPQRPPSQQSGAVHQQPSPRQIAPASAAPKPTQPVSDGYPQKMAPGQQPHPRQPLSTVQRQQSLQRRPSVDQDSTSNTPIKERRLADNGPDQTKQRADKVPPTATRSNPRPAESSSSRPTSRNANVDERVPHPQSRQQTSQSRETSSVPYNAKSATRQDNIPLVAPHVQNRIEERNYPRQPSTSDRPPSEMSMRTSVKHEVYQETPTRTNEVPQVKRQLSNERPLELNGTPRQKPQVTPRSTVQLERYPSADREDDGRFMVRHHHPADRPSSVAGDREIFRQTRPRSLDEQYYDQRQPECYRLRDNEIQYTSQQPPVKSSRRVMQQVPYYQAVDDSKPKQLIDSERQQQTAVNSKLKSSSATQLESTDGTQRTSVEPSAALQSTSLTKYTHDNNRHHHHHHHHHHHKQAPAIGGGGKYAKHTENRKRVPYSSSDDEMPSTSECQSCDDFESGSTSERGEIEKRRFTKYDDMNIQNLHTSSQIPVTWQASHDGTRMIGHLILHRQSNTSLGLKVVGGRPTPSGRLGAFLTRVKRGSIADVVGHLKPGDEVLEWNGRQLQDATFDDVCEIINESKHEPHVELIVSRPMAGAINQNVNALLKSKNLLYGSQIQVLDPVNNLVSGLDSLSLQQRPLMSTGSLLGSTAHLTSMLQDKTPVMMIATPSNYQSTLNMPSSIPYCMSKSSGQIFGKIQISLYYSVPEQQLIVGVHQAMDLPPRIDGSGRNPYVKMFLLPDRNEQSRRQSNTLANTCHPVWQQKFVYQRLVQSQLASRVLEITVWDYDQYGSNDFLGEALFELSTRLLDNEPRWYTLVDMDEESPARTKLRQQRLSSYTNQQTSMGRHGLPRRYDHMLSSYDSRVHGNLDYARPHSCNSGYRSDSGIFEEYLKSMPPRPRTSHRSRNVDLQPFTHGTDIDDIDSIYNRAAAKMNRSMTPNVSGTQTNEDFFGVMNPSTIASHSSSLQRNLPRIPADLYGEEAMRELDDKVQQLRNHGYTKRQQSLGRYPSTNTPTSSSSRRRSRRQPFEMSPGTGSAIPGYQSDESETSMSVTSTHSEKPPMKNVQEFQNRLDVALEKNEDYSRQDSNLSDSTMAVVIGNQSMKSNDQFALEANRKKSLMNRFIPGKTAAQNAHDLKKRLGFPRSEEVGIPYGMSPPRTCYTPQLMQQGSFESVGSVSSENSSWLPIIPPEGSLGEFISSLGPGQVVGRQVLASPCLGEIQMNISVKGGDLEVKVIRARNLVKKPGAKYNPAPYVKVYLMDGKHCVAKAKTNVAARTAEPRFDQHLIFTEPFRGRFLQISAWGDYGRMERKVFMGIALIKLDNLDFSTPVDGWYKLYHSNSLAGTSSPGRKASESVLADATSSGNGSLPIGQLRT